MRQRDRRASSRRPCSDRPARAFGIPRSLLLPHAHPARSRVLRLLLQSSLAGNGTGNPGRRCSSDWLRMHPVRGMHSFGVERPASHARVPSCAPDSRCPHGAAAARTILGSGRLPPLWLNMNKGYALRELRFGLWARARCRPARRGGKAPRNPGAGGHRRPMLRTRDMAFRVLARGVEKTLHSRHTRLQSTSVCASLARGRIGCRYEFYPNYRHLEISLNIR